MMGLLQSPLFMLAMAALLGGVVYWSGRGARQRRAARWERVTRGGTRRVPLNQGNLRKKDPNADTRLGVALTNISLGATLRRRFELAGMTVTLQAYLLRVAGIIIGVMLMLLFTGQAFVLAVIGGLIVGLGLPHFYVSRRIKKRKLAFLKLFPEAIELIVRGLRAGLPVAESFVVVSREIPDPVGGVFLTISQQAGFGVPMEKSLADSAKMLGMTEFNFFVTTIILQRETGGNLGEILSNLSQVLRDRQMMKLKIGALSSEARASGYIVGALPFFVFGALSVISPDYLRPLFDDYRGNMSLGIAAGMMLFGGFVMKRMTQFEI